MPTSLKRNPPPWRKATEVPNRLTNEYDGRGGWVALAQFAQDWNRRPEHRSAMIEDPLPAGTDPRGGAAIAAMVHALCVRDEIPVPDWVLDWRYHTPVTMVSGIDMESEFGKRIRVVSPAVCDFHNVFFEISLRDR